MPQVRLGAIQGIGAVSSSLSSSTGVFATSKDAELHRFFLQLRQASPLLCSFVLSPPTSTFSLLGRSDVVLRTLNHGRQVSARAGCSSHASSSSSSFVKFSTNSNKTQERSGTSKGRGGHRRRLEGSKALKLSQAQCAVQCCVLSPRSDSVLRRPR